MIRSLLICSALVASSAAGAVALSVLHDTTGDRQGRTLAPAPVAMTEPRFVIPNYVPASARAAVIEVALREAPELLENGPPDTAPVASAPVAENALPRITAHVVPREAALEKSPIASPNAVKAARAVRKASVRSLKKRYAAPVIVAQAPSFSASQPGRVQPDYVIGVYR